MLGLMKLDKLTRTQIEANDLLQGTILCERGQSWNKMAEKSKKMLKLISKANLPASFISPTSYNMLLYESYYHLGVALQSLGRHKESVHAYTSAMMSMNLRKNGCMAGCNSNTCFQTPVLAKRAFAHAKSGDVKGAFRDIEKAVVLDTHNPDLYCVRALLWNTRREPQKALDDLNRALSFNRNHVCALLLRGTIDQPVQMTFGLLEGISLNIKKNVIKDHQMAMKISPDASEFLDLGDVHHPKMIKFWNRFLRCLNVPRTVSHVDLTSAVIAQYNTTVAMSEEITGPLSRSTTATPLVASRARSVALSVDAASTAERPKSMPVPFRCGTPYGSDDGQINRTRRLSYGQALRTYTAKRQDTGVSEYIQRLVAHASRPNSAKKIIQRNEIPQISITRSPSPPPPPRPRSNSRKNPLIGVTNPPNHLHTPAVYPRSRRGSNLSIASCPVMYSRKLSIGSGSQKSLLLPSGTQRRASIAAVQPSHEEAAEFASKVHGIEVFNSVNVSDAPRMYYKPWGGDKLPVAELPLRKKVEAFRV